jgi:hypothetical protein
MDQEMTKVQNSQIPVSQKKKNSKPNPQKNAQQFVQKIHHLIKVNSKAFGD